MFLFWFHSLFSLRSNNITASRKTSRSGHGLTQVYTNVVNVVLRQQILDEGIDPCHCTDTITTKELQLPTSSIIYTVYLPKS